MPNNLDAITADYIAASIAQDVANRGLSACHTDRTRTLVEVYAVVTGDAPATGPHGHYWATLAEAIAVGRTIGGNLWSDDQVATLDGIECHALSLAE